MTLPGSSPLTRGKLGAVVDELIDGRLIPAHAGKTSSKSRGTSKRRAHPRSRGENVALAEGVGPAMGSSPLTRGKPLLEDAADTGERLIPAHAGKTKRITYLKRLTRAHPRSRGENWRALMISAGDIGSSPLTRGKRLAHVQRYADNLGSSPLTRGKPVTSRPSSVSRGLIPAHAGKTSRRRCRR